MRVKCLVPDCGGIIDAANPSTTPCPECVKRVQVMPRLQEQLRALQQQVVQLQSKAIGRMLPLLKVVAKKPGTIAELAVATKRAEPTLYTSMRKLEERGLVTVAEYRRVGKGATGVIVWRASALGEHLAHEGNGNGVGGGQRK